MIKCKDCKFMHRGIYKKQLCREPQARKFGEQIDPNYCIPLCDTINPKGYCAFYKRKWWKFWRPSKLELKVVQDGN